MVKIAISGKICSGKTTITNFVKNFLKEDKHNIECIELSFAARLKELCVELFDMPSDPLKKDRDLLQSFSDDCKKYNENVWVNSIINKAKDIDHVIVSDVRFKHEADRLKQSGFILIRLDIGSEEEQKERIRILYDDLSKQNLNHKSETDMDNYDKYDYRFLSDDKLKDNIVNILNKFYP
jgi:hypothetical protein